MKRYQIIYQVDENTNIVFVGSTNLSIDDLLDFCDSHLDVSLDTHVLAVSYDNFKVNENEQKKDE